MSEITKEKEIADMMRREMTRLRRLSSWHEKNIEVFSRIAFDNVEKIEIEYELPSASSVVIDSVEVNLEGLENTSGFLKLDLTIKKGKRGSSRALPAKKRAQDLKSWIKNLLYYNMNVEVRVNGRKR